MVKKTLAIVATVVLAAVAVATLVRRTHHS